MMNKWFVLSMVFLILLTNMAHSAANPKITIVTERWAPHIYQDDNGKVVGAMTDKVKAIMALAELDYSLTLYPWPRAYKIARTKKNVLIYPLFKSAERKPLFHFICPFTKKVDVYLFRLSSREDIQLVSLADAKQYRIGLIRDDYDHLYLLKHGFEDGKQIDANVDDVSSLKKLLIGRIDLMVNSISAMERMLVEQKIDGSKITNVLKIVSDHDDDSGENCIGMSMGTSEAIVEKVRAGLLYINKTQPMLSLE